MPLAICAFEYSRVFLPSRFSATRKPSHTFLKRHTSFVKGDNNCLADPARPFSVTLRISTVACCAFSSGASALTTWYSPLVGGFLSSQSTA